ncbi:FeoB-associated Cys-rich membrane protein [Aneurinibacillus sp. Ricciae_BoGa-3]|uniref:FeoB-associated Cys-rich membrane protein n=1 Tax=Aneurinibacillus sp. Ricciae_BoGa-3 TaxID=3022697 RepID=UPI0023406D55|nr:FeoB-associated Cys-rich membrane protein [Aneurinibacillus sp. Ricciae_BoGa-3]WCK55710.1 FeoB-associated Cys-rich membrane protein [Aneurinibacillus sp. Ricciae_BoGa-3]
MVFNILIGILIFGYAGWTLFRFVNKSKEGKCAGCSIKNSCQSGCSTNSIEFSARYPDTKLETK